jgi:hypothetical protein
VTQRTLHTQRLAGFTNRPSVRDQVEVKGKRFAGRHPRLHLVKRLLRRCRRRLDQSNSVTQTVDMRIYRKNIHTAGKRQHDGYGFNPNPF